MKTIIFSLVLLFIPMQGFAGGWKFYFFGVDLEWFKEGNWDGILLGAACSLIGHKIGHISYLHSNGKYKRVEGNILNPHIAHDDLSLRESRRYGRSGFILQSLVGITLTSFEGSRYSDFAKGWVAMTNLQLALYHAWHDDWGDFGTIEDNGGNRDRDYNFFRLMAARDAMVLVTSEGTQRKF